MTSSELLVPLLPVYVLSSGSLPYGLVRAGTEKVPNLSCLSFPIVPSSVPRRLGDCIHGCYFIALSGLPRLRIRSAPHIHAWPVLRVVRVTRLQSSLYATARENC